MSVSEMRRLEELESANQRRKKLVAEKELHIDTLKDIVKIIQSPHQRRSAVEDMKARKIIERKEYFLIGIPRSTCRYTPIQDPLNEKIRPRMRELAHMKRRYGSLRLTGLLRREFGAINHNRVEHLYALEGLTLPRKRKKKRSLLERVAIPVPEGPNERWSMDFVHDSFDSERKFRMLNIVDDFNRDCLRIEVDTSLSGHRVSRVLAQLAETRGLPKYIVVDNGTEFSSRAMIEWENDNPTNLAFIDPGKPTQNALVESFMES
jgi:putative transposase